MTALTQDRDPRRKEGLLGSGPAYQSVKLYGGALAMWNSSGYIIPGADTASCIFAGVVNKQVDNSSGSSGDKTVEFWRNGLFLVTLGHTISQANVGDQVYLSDDQTVDVAAQTTNDIYCGIIAEYVDTTHAWIDIQPAVQQADVATHMADASAAHAASAISIADAGSYTAQTQVEAALQEIYPGVPHVAIADPGDAAAIPVTRAGVCAMTTAGAETRTLAIPTYVGQILVLTEDVHVGNNVITVASSVDGTNNTLTFDAAGETLVLIGTQIAGTKCWRILVNIGSVGLSAV